MNWTELGWLVNSLRAASPSPAPCALFHKVSPLLSTYHVAVYILIFFSIVFIDYEKVFDCEDHNKLWKILKETGIPDHLTCLLRNLYAGQEATVRTGHGTIDWFQIGKGVPQGCILSPYVYGEYIMKYTRLDEAQAGIKIAGRNVNNLRYADDTLTAESE